MLWGADLSPFALKVEALLRFAGLPFRWLPEQAGFLEAHRFNLRRQRVVSRRLPLTWPELSELDEFPLVQEFLSIPIVTLARFGLWVSTQDRPSSELVRSWPGGRQARAMAIVDRPL